MSLVGKQAPEFIGKAVMPNDEIRDLALSDYRGRYIILLFYPADFTFVCPTEVIAFNHAVEEFKELDCEIIGISVDSVFSHFAWRNMEVAKGGIGKIDFPLVSDITKVITQDYGVFWEVDGVALRGLFLLDKRHIVRHQVVNDLSLGRSVSEAKRILEALQFYEKYGEVCPANWQKGLKGMKPVHDGLIAYHKR